MKKNLFIVFCILFATFVIAAAGLAVWFNSELQAPSNTPDKKTVLITRGSSAEKIAVALHDAGVIRNDFVFRLYLKIHKLQTVLPPGEFLIPQNLSVPDVIALLRKGPNEVWVTIPEGLRREQIPDRFTSALELTDAQARFFTDSFLESSKTNEGYLFPETYLVPKDITADKVVNLLTSTFQKKFGASFPDSKAELKDVVILASIIERETRTDSEKPVIAGILKNRMAIGIPLQVDATVQYAKATKLCGGTGKTCENWWPTVYLDDYKFKSTFNTYLISGLPPSPIANAGLASLKAAENPTSSDYLYYIHDKSGVAHYAKTLDEHNANVRKYID